MATLTITTTAPQDARLGPAFGDLLRLGRNATTAEVKAWTIDQYRNVVFEFENRAAVAAIATPGAFAPT